jgi:hypothetical protein
MIHPFSGRDRMNHRDTLLLDDRRGIPKRLERHPAPLVNQPQPAAMMKVEAITQFLGKDQTPRPVDGNYPIHMATLITMGLSIKAPSGLLRASLAAPVFATPRTVVLVRHGQAWPHHA